MIILRQKSFGLFDIFKHNKSNNYDKIENELPQDYYRLLDIYDKKLHEHDFYKTDEFRNNIWSIPYPHLIVLHEDKIDKTTDTTGLSPIVYLNNEDMIGLGYDFKNKCWYEISTYDKVKNIPNLKNYITSYVRKTTDKLKTVKISVYDPDAPSEVLLYKELPVDLMGKKDYNLMLKYCNDLYNSLTKYL